LDGQKRPLGVMKLVALAGGLDQQQEDEIE
jgi:hypothetical protein